MRLPDFMPEAPPRWLTPIFLALLAVVVGGALFSYPKVWFLGVVALGGLAAYTALGAWCSVRRNWRS